MQSVGLFLKTRKEIIDWHKEYHPGNLLMYEALLNQIKSTKFLGSKLLLKKEKDKTGDNFLTLLTELNLVNKILLSDGVNIEYEQQRKVDFTFDNFIFSVKSWNVKEYEKTIQEMIIRLRVEGGGRDSFSYKGGSTIAIDVQKVENDMFSEEIIETGAVSHLDTDYAHLNGILSSISEFETVDSQDGKKKVLFIMNYSDSFTEYYAVDLACWYFDLYQEHPIFPDPTLYFKYFGKEQKLKNIDAIVFVMYMPVPFLVWPAGCLGDTRGDKTRTLIFSPDQKLVKDIKSLLFR